MGLEEMLLAEGKDYPEEYIKALQQQAELYGEEYALKMHEEIERLNANILEKIEDNSTLFIAVVGMPGSGKSLVTDYLRTKFGDKNWVRFGQPTLSIKALMAEYDIQQGRPEKTQETYERPIREIMRKRYGMDAYAKLNLPAFEKVLRTGTLIGDDLMSWEELVKLRGIYPNRIVVVAVVAGASFRYEKITNRGKDIIDPNLRYRPFTREEAISRDISQIENLHSGGPIAFADYYIMNQTETVEDVEKQTEEFLAWAFKERGLRYW